ncbi:SRPBCC family protein [Georgenia sp. Z1491]|uniref:SRPBCC family protein n=1 Tax=Georgenia sp. Z1491 TaxID=3416707 RepID=UPI003CEDAA14
MSETTSENTSGSALEGLKQQAIEFAKTAGRKALSSAGDRVDDLVDRFEGSGGSAGEAAKAGAEKIAEGESPAKAALSAAGTGIKDKIAGAFGGGSSGGSGDFKFMNIVESADLGVPVSAAYNAFTQFEDWPDFMKKVEHAERGDDDVTVTIKGQVMWSHRTWDATITEQVADSHIVWESTGEKGHISGSVSFHEVAPRLTRMVMVLEYHPQGFVEKTANIWRAAGRRARLEMKFFVHHVMTETILDPDGVEGWRGEIRDGELVTSHEDTLEQEAADREAAEAEGGDQPPESEEESAEDEPYEDEPYEDEEPPEAEAEAYDDEEAFEDDPAMDEDAPADDEELSEEEVPDEDTAPAADDEYDDEATDEEEGRA